MILVAITLLTIISISAVAFILLRDGLRWFKFLKWLVSSERGLRFTNWAYSKKWSKKHIDGYLERLMGSRFRFGKTYKFRQNKFLLSIKPPDGWWEYAVLDRGKQASRNKHYEQEMVFKTENYYLMKMTRKKCFSTATTSDCQSRTHTEIKRAS